MLKRLTLLAGLMSVGIAVIAQQTETKAPPPPPPRPPEPPTVVITKFDAPPKFVEPKSLKIFYKRNPTIQRLSWVNQEKLTVTLKDGTSKKYDFANPEEEAAFEKLYGPAPVAPPPPPPPVPPTPPVEVS